MTKTTAYAALNLFANRISDADILDNVKDSFVALDAIHDELVEFGDKLPGMTQFDHVNGMRSPTSKCIDLQASVTASIGAKLAELDMGWGEAADFFARGISQTTIKELNVNDGNLVLGCLSETLIRPTSLSYPRTNAEYLVARGFLTVVFDYRDGTGEAAEHTTKYQQADSIAVRASDDTRAALGQ